MVHDFTAHGGVRVDVSDDYVIQTHGLTKSFNGIHALKGLNLNVPRHAIFGFLGPNGAGKSTTIKLLLGLEKPTSGGGTIFGLDIRKQNLDIRRRVGYLAQDPHFYGRMTARETLRFTARFFFAGPKTEIEARVEDVLELVDLKEKADRPIHRFSSGERQRLGIAQAQINEPELLILDEPAASLDPIGRHQVLEIMERLREKTTIFYSTHILSDVQRISDAVAILDKGKLVAQASIDDLLAGTGGTCYSVTFKGDGRRALSAITSQPWVTSVTTVPARNGQTSWEICVNDVTVAESRLVRMLADHDVAVTSCGRKRYNLEEVFLSLVKEPERD